MPAKPSGQIKTSVIKNPQKNGDTYILERRTIYDPEKKYTKVLSTKLIAKIPKGSEIPVPTRPKRAAKSPPDTRRAFLQKQGKNFPNHLYKRYTA